MIPTAMRARSLALCIVCVVSVLAARLPAASVPSPAASQLLPDSAVLARVDTRTIRVSDFVAGYARADPSMRPGQDSTGRVEFLETLVNKDVLGLTARALNQPLSFENRLILRSFTSSTLATAYYKSRVENTVRVTNADLEALYPQYSWELKLRYLLVGDEATALRIRSELMAGKLQWADAVRRYSLGPDSLATKDLGWVKRAQLVGAGTAAIFDLKPLGLTQPLKDADGYRLWQCLGRRATPAPPFNGVRIELTQELRAARIAPKREQFFAEAAKLADAKYDTANIVWLAKRFEDEYRNAAPEAPGVLDLTSRIPRIAPEDTSRVLMWVHGKPFTVYRMIATYRSVNGVFRPKIQGLGSLLDTIQRMTLEPDIVTMARADGFEKNPAVVEVVEDRREGLMVDQMYTDSVLAHVRVTEAERKKIYEAHRDRFMSREKARYVVLVRGSEAGADSVMRQIAAGTPPQQIAMLDSLGGMRYQAYHEDTEDEAGGFRDIVFGEMKPGESTKLNRTSGWVVIHLLGRVPSHQQSYEEVQDTVDQMAQAEEEDRVMNAWIARLRKQHRIESHPERVMQFSVIPKTPETVRPED